MTALCILAGLLLLLLGWAALWWTSRSLSPWWLLLSLLPPLALLAGLWQLRRAWWAVLVSLTGTGLLAFGLWQLHLQQPENFQRLLRLQWALPTTAADSPALGRLLGQPFYGQRISLEQGVLSLGDGNSFLEAGELRLDLSTSQYSWQAGIFYADVLPDDPPPLPRLELLGPYGEQAEPLVRNIRQGYSLRLALQPDEQGCSGDLYLRVTGPLDISLDGPLQLDDCSALPAPVVAPAKEPEFTVAPAVTTGGVLLLPLLLANPELYLEQELQLELVDGRSIKGRFQGLGEEGGLQIRQAVKAPGYVIFELPLTDIVRLTQISH